MFIFPVCTKSAYRMYSNSTKSERSENENRNLRLASQATALKFLRLFGSCAF